MTYNSAMAMTETEIRKKVDRHHGRTDFSINKNYVEFYFHACFYELFNSKDLPWERNLDGSEFIEILEILNIKIDLELLIAKYSDQKNYDAEVFHSSVDEQVFVYIDPERDPTDQNYMFFLGISCLKKDEPVVHEKLLNIYRKLNIASAFKFDIWNDLLYNKVFRSYFYFYNNGYNESKKRLNHHDL